MGKLVHILLGLLYLDLGVAGDNTQAGARSIQQAPIEFGVHLRELAAISAHGDTVGDSETGDISI